MDYITGGGYLPAFRSQAQLLWYLSANYGVWAAGVPLWELPPDVGAEFIGLCQSLRPALWVKIEEMMEVVGSQ